MSMKILFENNGKSFSVESYGTEVIVEMKMALQKVTFSFTKEEAKIVGMILNPPNKQLEE